MERQFFSPDSDQQPEEIRFKHIETAMKALRVEIDIMRRGIEQVIDQMMDIRAKRGEPVEVETNLAHVEKW